MDCTLLDVGCFPGHLAILSANRGYKVYGLNNDIEESSPYNKFIHKMKNAGIVINYCNVETEIFPYPSESFDVVMCCELLEHLWLNPFHMINEIFRVLNPG